MQKTANKKTVSVLVIILIVIGVATAVTVGLFLFPYNPDEPPRADDVGSTPKGIQEVVNANNQFAFDLYSELAKTEKDNIFYSPYSISAALAMTYEGAKGKTAEEIKEVFHFPETSVLRPNYAAIYNKINEDNKEYQLSTGNALWVQQDYLLLNDYSEAVERYYGGKASNVDFIKETEKSRQTINSFIEEQTNNKVKELIPAGQVDHLTRLVITNAIYFKGTWEWEFDKSDTRDKDFYITPENVVKTPMMHMDSDKATFNYADLEKLQILELPYKGDKISMLILLPKQGEAYDYEKGEEITYNYNLEDIELSSEKLNEYKSEMQETKLSAIYLPKFKFDTKYFMVSTLSEMGMPTAFSMQADLSGIDGSQNLYIQNVIHQAFVQVDEKGTEAAAATSITIGFKSAMPSNVFTADHPFIFIIQEKETGNILFMGRMTDPTKAQ
ncbi:MAG TPA: serpin family protein [Candidatus Pacearchaeota archaeon]|nr:serpin family protein [Candidatus Pacearchaeota archaeon]